MTETSGPNRVCGRPLAHARHGRRTCRDVILTDYAQACWRHETPADRTVRDRLIRRARDEAQERRGSDE